MKSMKKIYLVQFEEYSDAFCAFEEYGNAYEFAAAYAASTPKGLDGYGVGSMIKEAFVIDAGSADARAELDRMVERINREDEEALDD